MPTTLRDYCWQIDLGSVNAYLVYDVADPDLAEPVTPTPLAAHGSPEAAADGGTGADSTLPEAGEDVLDHEGALTLVDAGTRFHADDVVRAIRDAGFSLPDVERVLVTHFDQDHVGALAGLADRGLDATVYMGQPDADYLTGRLSVPLESPASAFRRVTRPLLRRPDLPIDTVADGDVVGSFTVYHTPGHTPGHVAYASEPLSVAFVGDLVREDHGRFEPSPWYVSDDTEAVRDSIHDFADRAPAVEVIGPGHGVPFLRNGSVRLAELGQRIE